MDEDPRAKAEDVARALEAEGAAAEAERIRNAARTGGVGTALLFALREACEVVLTAVESIDPTTETLLEELRVEVEKRLSPTPRRTPGAS